MSIAEKIRNIDESEATCPVDYISLAITGKQVSCAGSCIKCRKKWYGKLADAIEAEQNGAVAKALAEEVAKPENIGIGLLHDVAKDLEEYAQMIEGALSEDLAHYAAFIRNALRGAKPQLPEGVIWPTYEDGELVKFGDKFVDVHGCEAKAKMVIFGAEGFVFNAGYSPKFCRGYGTPVKRPEPEVLDADGVPIKVGDTVWNVESGKRYEVLELPAKNAYQSVAVRGEDGTDGFDPARLTHRKPDTQEAINEDCWLDAKDYCEKHNVKTEWPKHYGKAKCEHLLARQRKLLGGE